MIRRATEADLEAMLAIYGPYVESTTISFEYTPPTPEEFAGLPIHLMPRSFP